MPLDITLFIISLHYIIFIIAFIIYFIFIYFLFFMIFIIISFSLRLSPLTLYIWFMSLHALSRYAFACRFSWLFRHAILDYAWLFICHYAVIFRHYISSISYFFITTLPYYAAAVTCIAISCRGIADAFAIIFAFAFHMPNHYYLIFYVILRYRRAIFHSTADDRWYAITCRLRISISCHIIVFQLSALPFSHYYFLLIFHFASIYYFITILITRFLHRYFTFLSIIIAADGFHYIIISSSFHFRCIFCHIFIAIAIISLCHFLHYWHYFIYFPLFSPFIDLPFILPPFTPLLFFDIIDATIQLCRRWFATMPPIFHSFFHSLSILFIFINMPFISSPCRGCRYAMPQHFRFRLIASAIRVFPLHLIRCHFDFFTFLYCLLCDIFFFVSSLLMLYCPPLFYLRLWCFHAFFHCLMLIAFILRSLCHEPFSFGYAITRFHLFCFAVIAEIFIFWLFSPMLLLSFSPISYAASISFSSLIICFLWLYYWLLHLLTLFISRFIDDYYWPLLIFFHFHYYFHLIIY